MMEKYLCPSCPLKLNGKCVGWKKMLPGKVVECPDCPGTSPEEA